MFCFFLLFANIGKCNPLSSVVGQFHWSTFSRSNNLVWLTSKRHRRITFWSMLLQKRNFLFSCLYFIIVFRALAFLYCIWWLGLHFSSSRRCSFAETHVFDGYVEKLTTSPTATIVSLSRFVFSISHISSPDISWSTWITQISFFLDIMWNFISV